jgi:transcriptional regulator with XRE-family HTH domain
VSNSLGNKIRILRKAKELTLEQLAEQTDSSKGYIWELENRDTRKPSAEKLMKIAEVLGVTTEFLLDDSKDSPDDSVMKKAFFRKFEKLGVDDQQRVMKIIEGWGEDKK